MSVSTVLNSSLLCLSAGSAMAFYFILGLSTREPGEPFSSIPFSLLGIPSLLLMVSAFLLLIIAKHMELAMKAKQKTIL